LQPVGRRDEPLRQQFDVEAQMARALIDGFFVGRQQIRKQRAKAGLVQLPCHVAVARAEPAAAASMREQHQPRGAGREAQVAVQHGRAGRYAHGMLLDHAMQRRYGLHGYTPDG
jgi:hypothetical protein